MILKVSPIAIVFSRVLPWESASHRRDQETFGTILS